MSPPPSAFLADVYHHLPFLVIHTTTDGTVLHCNPETLRATGYQEAELLGKNLWVVLFPGKLFAQVPKFISLVQPTVLLKDVPMTIRTKSGGERVIAFTRHFHGGASTAAGGALDHAGGGGAGGGARTFICIGVDLTDRLLDAERDQLPASELPGPGLAGKNGNGLVPFGPHIGNAGTVDGEVVTPIAISPRSPRGPVSMGETVAGGPCPVEQVREGLARVDTHMSCVAAAVNEGELHAITMLVDSLQKGLVGIADGAVLQFIAQAPWLHAEIQGKAMGGIRARVDELLTLYRPEMR